MQTNSVCVKNLKVRGWNEQSTCGGGAAVDNSEQDLNYYLSSYGVTVEQIALASYFNTLHEVIYAQAVGVPKIRHPHVIWTEDGDVHVIGFATRLSQIVKFMERGDSLIIVRHKQDYTPVLALARLHYHSVELVDIPGPYVVVRAADYKSGPPYVTALAAANANQTPDFDGLPALLLTEDATLDILQTTEGWQDYQDEKIMENGEDYVDTICVNNASSPFLTLL